MGRSRWVREAAVRTWHRGWATWFTIGPPFIRTLERIVIEVYRLNGKEPLDSFNLWGEGIGAMSKQVEKHCFDWPVIEESGHGAHVC